ncbi:MAG: hypothetical protein LBK99_22790 [Opitutaceae bacterium]|nr:hypothetical protein [Opitutaceae bacterium]
MKIHAINFGRLRNEELYQYPDGPAQRPVRPDHKNPPLRNISPGSEI